MWRELIRDSHPVLEPLGGSDPGPEFFPRATPEELADVERQVGVRLPDSLRELLAETNGVLVNFGTHIIWPTSTIVSRNLEVRERSCKEDYMPLDHLLFFGDAGVDGLLFAFGIIRGAIRRENVYMWNPIDDGREWKAPSLRTYIEWSLAGKLRV